MESLSIIEAINDFGIKIYENIPKPNHKIIKYKGIMFQYQIHKLDYFYYGSNDILSIRYIKEHIKNNELIDYIIDKLKKYSNNEITDFTEIYPEFLYKFIIEKYYDELQKNKLKESDTKIDIQFPHSKLYKETYDFIDENNLLKNKIAHLKDEIEYETKQLSDAINKQSKEEIENKKLKEELVELEEQLELIKKKLYNTVEYNRNKQVRELCRLGNICGAGFAYST